MLVGTDDAASKPPRGPHGSIYNLRACGVSKQDGRVEEISDKLQSALGYTVTNSEIRFGICGHQQFSPQAIGRLLKQTRVGGREETSRAHQLPLRKSQGRSVRAPSVRVP